MEFASQVQVLALTLKYQTWVLTLIKMMRTSAQTNKEHFPNSPLQRRGKHPSPLFYLPAFLSIEINSCSVLVSTGRFGLGSNIFPSLSITIKVGYPLTEYLEIKG